MTMPNYGARIAELDHTIVLLDAYHARAVMNGQLDKAHVIREQADAARAEVAQLRKAMQQAA